MPVYEAKCSQCGTVTDYYQSVANCMKTPECCGHSMTKVILTAPMGYVENIEYQSPIDGRPITTKQARLDDLARNNCRPWEGLDQEVKVAQSRAKEEEKKADKAIEDSVVSAWNSLEPEKRRVLETAA